MGDVRLKRSGFSWGLRLFSMLDLPRFGVHEKVVAGSPIPRHEGDGESAVAGGTD